MKAKEIVARARWYEQEDEAPPAECLLSVLIDLFTDELDDAEDVLTARTVQQAWERLTRDLSMSECLDEHQSFLDGVDVLAGNLAEAGRRDLAATLRTIAQPRVEGAAHSTEIDITEMRRFDDVPEPQADGRLWVPRGATPIGHGV